MHHFIRVAARPLAVCSSGSRSSFFLVSCMASPTVGRGIVVCAIWPSGRPSSHRVKKERELRSVCGLNHFFLTLLCVGERSVVHTQSPQLGRDVDRMWRVCFPPWIQQEPLRVLLSENGHCVYKVPFSPVPALETQALAQSCCTQESFLSRPQ